MVINANVALLRVFMGMVKFVMARKMNVKQGLTPVTFRPLAPIYSVVIRSVDIQNLEPG